MMPPKPHRNRRQDLLLPLAISGLLLGSALLAAFVFAAPRIALAVVVLSYVVLLAVVHELILIGDR